MFKCVGYMPYYTTASFCTSVFGVQFREVIPSFSREKFGGFMGIAQFVLWTTIQVSTIFCICENK
jgi:hypothetical protein